MFIALSPPEKVRERLAGLREKWPGLPSRWIKPGNIHLTVIPPMYLDENQVSQLVSVLEEAGKRISPFLIILERIIYGPPGKPSRMLWALGKESAELIALEHELEEAILDAKIPFLEEVRPFKYPHLTLARMFQGEWREFSPKPEINEEFHAEIPVEAIFVMESILQRGGAEYVTLARIPLEGS